MRYTNHHNIHGKGTGPFRVIMALVVGAVDVTVAAAVAAGLVLGVPIGGSVMDFDHPK